MSFQTNLSGDILKYLNDLARSFKNKRYKINFFATAMKNHSSFRKINFRLASFASAILFSCYEIRAQMPKLQVPAAVESDAPEDYTWWYAALFLLALGLIGTVIWRMNAKKAAGTRAGKPRKKAVSQATGDSLLDAGKELEWFRKNQKLMGGNKNGSNGKNNQRSRLPANRSGVDAEAKTPRGDEKLPAELPVFSIEKIEPARPFAPLPISNDEALMSAIEQTHEEFEEDEEVRELSVRILTAFKTRNSVDALSQVALYDLSSNLRSKAVTILSDFDHESVFETILLACADPTREVKAAAARALFHLSFDRANAWTRIADSDEEGRMRQTARAAIEADLVNRSLDRLVHQDNKIAREAAAFAALMIKSGETVEVFDALVKHKDLNVRKAILHIIKITKNQKALEKLYSLLEQNNLPLGFQEEIDKTIEAIGFVTV